MNVSLVMAVYNGEEYLLETIRSILAQTYPNLEIIIVNDGSTDSTSKILNDIDDNRVKIIHLNDNAGAANALNMAISQAKGDWIAIHDSDDISLPDRIQEQVSYIRANPHIIALGSFIECIEGKSISPDKAAHMKNLERYKNSITDWKQIKEDLFKGCPIIHGSLLMSKEAFLKAGKYDPRYKIAYDYDLYVRLAAIGPIQNIPKVLYKYRVSSNSLSNLNVSQTSKEFLLSCIKYIRNYRFAHKKNNPGIAVYGTANGCKAFNELMQSEKNMSIKAMMTSYDLGKLSKAYIDFKNGRIDAFIILTNAPKANDLIRYLTRRGLRLNKDFFTLWSEL